MPPTAAAPSAATRLEQWWSSEERTDDPAAAFAVAAAEGRLDLPRPGSGRTLERWSALAAATEADVVFGRLVEAHADADSILAELGGAATALGGGAVWGVWAAEPPQFRLAARLTGAGWRLDGTKAWCSGAGTLTHALVTAWDGESSRLFAVELDPAVTQPVEGTWPAVGMAASDSRQVRFAGAPATPVGQAGDYTGRPGFWHGAIGVAACWYGGAVGVARPLARAPRLDPHALAHLGAVDVALAGARQALAAAAAEIDADPLDTAGRGRLLALRTRGVVEAAATAVLDRVGRALGPTPICADAAHGRRVADLPVYLRQSHAERDLADLADAVRGAATGGVLDW